VGDYGYISNFVWALIHDIKKALFVARLNELLLYIIA
jgi:hypothetical protein